MLKKYNDDNNNKQLIYTSDLYFKKKLTILIIQLYKFFSNKILVQMFSNE